MDEGTAARGGHSAVHNSTGAKGATNVRPAQDAALSPAVPGSRSNRAPRLAAAFQIKKIDTPPCIRII
jgi:hypothetical protein